MTVQYLKFLMVEEMREVFLGTETYVSILLRLPYVGTFPNKDHTYTLTFSVFSPNSVTSEDFINKNMFLELQVFELF